jgi:hypothetical protein
MLNWVNMRRLLLQCDPQLAMNWDLLVENGLFGTSCDPTQILLSPTTPRSCGRNAPSLRCPGCGDAESSCSCPSSKCAGVARRSHTTAGTTAEMVATISRTLTKLTKLTTILDPPYYMGSAPQIAAATDTRLGSSDTSCDILAPMHTRPARRTAAESARQHRRVCRSAAAVHQSWCFVSFAIFVIVVGRVAFPT